MELKGREGRQEGGESQCHAGKWKNNMRGGIRGLTKKEGSRKQGGRKGAKGGEREKQDVSKENGEKCPDKSERTGVPQPKKTNLKPLFLLLTTATQT